MANVIAPLGFSLIKTGGHEPVRRARNADASRGASGTIAPGDAYTIEADGNVARCDGNTQPNGICEAIQLQAVNEGPVSYQVLPGDVAGVVIGIEDPTAQFAVESQVAVAQGDLDSGAEVNVVDAVPDSTLGQSRQEVGSVGGNQLRLVGIVDTVNNDQTLINVKVIVGLIPANVQ